MNGLTGFFAASRADDARIRAAAALVNRGIRSTTVQFSRSTIDAVKASVPTRTAHAIPAGLNGNLLRAVLVVYSDLVARSAAFNPVEGFGTRARAANDPECRWLLEALRGGSRVARRYPADVASVRAIAGVNPPIRGVRPDSRQAAELAVRIVFIDGVNNCCGGSGGHVMTQLAPIVWKTDVTPYGRWDGTIQSTQFRVTYTRGIGWTVVLNAG